MNAFPLAQFRFTVSVLPYARLSRAAAARDLGRKKKPNTRDLWWLIKEAIYRSKYHSSKLGASPISVAINHVKRSLFLKW
jgi:hypothetical protein